MATDINMVTLIGRLTADPQLRYLPNGNAVVEFSIANNYYVPNKDKEVNYFDIVAYGKTAENASKYLSKGKQIAMSGSLRQDRWQDKESGGNRSKVRIIMQNMQILTPRDSADGGGYSGGYDPDTSVAPAPRTQPAAQPMPSSVDIGGFADEDDVPF